jgi:hypothetical protein
VDIVWPYLGADVPNYIEPHCGSAAMLLGRPGGPGKIETINDADRMVANFWRAIIADPWAVAAWCDSPVNEADMHAQHKWLVQQLLDGAEFREQMHADPAFFDAKIAGVWCWGICQWIGGGWCVEPQNKKHPKLDGIGKGVHSLAGSNAADSTRPHMSGTHSGMGVHSSEHHKRPVLDGTALGRGVHAEGPFLSQQIPNFRVDSGASGLGVNASAKLAEAYSPGRRPALSHAGQGVHLPSLGNDRGIHGVSVPGTFQHALRELLVPDAPPCFEWFARLALRLRRVRVACGDWRRVLGPSVLGKGKNVGGRRPCAIFFDPPYDPKLRSPYLYGEDERGISAGVRDWCVKHGDDPDLRIALCGYEGEHDMPSNWRVVEWKAARGYASEDNDNRTKERIWFSPHCLNVDRLDRQVELFGGVA